MIGDNVNTTVSDSTNTNYIQSSNYGTSNGWKIDANGFAHWASLEEPQDGTIFFDSNNLFYFVYKGEKGGWQKISSRIEVQSESWNDSTESTTIDYCKLYTDFFDNNLISDEWGAPEKKIGWMHKKAIKESQNEK